MHWGLHPAPLPVTSCGGAMTPLPAPLFLRGTLNQGHSSPQDRVREGGTYGVCVLHRTGFTWGCSKSWGPSTAQPWALGTPSVLWAWFPFGDLLSPFLTHVQTMKGSRPNTFWDEVLGLEPDQGHTALPHPFLLSRCWSPCAILLGASCTPRALTWALCLLWPSSISSISPNEGLLPLFWMPTPEQTHPWGTTKAPAPCSPSFPRRPRSERPAPCTHPTARPAATRRGTPGRTDGCRSAGL